MALLEPGERVWLSHPIKGTMSVLPSSLYTLFNSLAFILRWYFVHSRSSKSLYFERFGEKPWVSLKCPTGRRNSNPWTEEPGGLQSMGSQRVGRDWRDGVQNVTDAKGKREQRGKDTKPLHLQRETWAKTMLLPLISLNVMIAATSGRPSCWPPSLGPSHNQMFHLTSRSRFYLNGSI